MATAFFGADAGNGPPSVDSPITLAMAARAQAVSLFSSITGSDSPIVVRVQLPENGGGEERELSPGDARLGFATGAATGSEGTSGGAGAGAGGAGGGGGGGGGGAAPLDSVKCCVSKFCYPKSVFLEIERGEFGATLLVVFSMEATFLPGGKGGVPAVYANATIIEALAAAEKKKPGSTYGPNPIGEPTPPPPVPDPDPKTPDPEANLECSCPCCTFEQRIELKKFDGAKKEMSTLREPVPFGWTLDCFWFKRGEPKKRFSDQTESPGEGWELICAGRTGKSAEGSKQVAEGWTEAECKYKFKDSSNWSAKAEFSLEVNWEGRISDRCRQKVRRVKTFGIVLSSTGTAQVAVDGKKTDAPVYPTTTPGTKRWKWNNPDEECK